jgi:hypothetical protein
MKIIYENLEQKSWLWTSLLLLCISLVGLSQIVLDLGSGQ